MNLPASISLKRIKGHYITVLDTSNLYLRTLLFIQEYIHVISRPMVIKRVYHTTWTSVYIDVAVGGGNFYPFACFYHNHLMLFTTATITQL